MAVVPICSKMPYKDQRGFICGCIASADGPRCFTSIAGDICRRWHVSYLTTHIMTKTETKKGNASRRLLSNFSKSMTEVTFLRRAFLTENHLRSTSDNDSPQETFSTVFYASDSSSNENQLRSLDSYFGKLEDDAKLSPSDTSHIPKQLLRRRGHFKSKKGLESLNAYVGKLSEGNIPVS